MRADAVKVVEVSVSNSGVASTGVNVLMMFVESRRGRTGLESALVLGVAVPALAAEVGRPADAQATAAAAAHMRRRPALREPAAEIFVREINLDFLRVRFGLQGVARRRRAPEITAGGQRRAGRRVFGKDKQMLYLSKRNSHYAVFLGTSAFGRLIPISGLVVGSGRDGSRRLKPSRYRRKTAGVHIADRCLGHAQPGTVPDSTSVSLTRYAEGVPMIEKVSP
ncbi:hypothetical protein GCM10023193_60880 [Planotetraspora kaengkrachanensis]|uniref:Uncharacterized protein n=1 Tax=Planotetraspora kaengkrachanensis TaxID=575193 RepID=A0A8J3VA38_9ACTN|nr:hypothetical protein Pka01_56560 [Planotetraspora kaengkrachanensis]